VPLPAVEPTDVAAYAPAAPVVTPEKIAEAADWIELWIEKAAVAIPDPASRQGRELKRAICAYSLCLQARVKASTGRVGTAAAATKALTVGPIKVEKVAVDVEAQAAGAVTSGQEWFYQTWRHLVAAGVPRPPLSVGASA